MQNVMDKCFSDAIADALTGDRCKEFKSLDPALFDVEIG
jgi:hypothetical protein